MITKKLITSYLEFNENKNMVDPYPLAIFESTDMESKQAAEIMAECRRFIFTKLPFFAALLIRLPLIETKDPKYQTMCTNGIAIWYNAKFVIDVATKDSYGSVAWVICHEIMHCALGHISRIQGRDHQLWNYATDYAINLLIGPDLSDKRPSLGPGVYMPEGGLYDEKYVTMSSEQIYNILAKDMAKNIEKLSKHKNFGEVTNDSLPIPKDVWDKLPKEIKDEILGEDSGEEDGDEDGSGSGGDQEGKDGKPGQGKGKPGEGEGDDQEGSGKGKGQGKDGKPGEGQGDEGGNEGQGEGQNGIKGKIGKNNKSGDITPSRDQIEKRDKMNVREASRNIGKAGSMIARGFNNETKPKVDWKRELKKFITTITDRIQHVLPNRRFIHSGQYLYGTKKDYSLDTAVVIFDTSGSVNDDMIGQMAAELTDIREKTSCANLYVLYCDAAIAKVDLFKRADKIKVKAAGGGGTSFVPPFKWIQKNLLDKRKKVEIVVYLTDGYGDFPPKPAYHQKVIWVILDSPVVPPWGKILRVNTK